MMQSTRYNYLHCLMKWPSSSRIICIHKLGSSVVDYVISIISLKQPKNKFWGKPQAVGATYIQE